MIRTSREDVRKVNDQAENHRRDQRGAKEQFARARDRRLRKK